MAGERIYHAVMGLNLKFLKEKVKGSDGDVSREWRH